MDGAGVVLCVILGLAWLSDAVVWTRERKELNRHIGELYRLLGVMKLGGAVTERHQYVAMQTLGRLNRPSDGESYYTEQGEEGESEETEPPLQEKSEGLEIRGSFA